MSDLVTIGVMVVDVVVTADVTLVLPAKLNVVNVFDPVLPNPPKMEVGFDVSGSVVL